MFDNGAVHQPRFSSFVAVCLQLQAEAGQDNTSHRLQLKSNMAEFLADPSVLTKDKLKTELAANNVPLPSGDHKKEVYVQLYLKNLTVLNSKNSASTDTFSSDEELPAPVVTNRSRSGRVSLYKCLFMNLLSLL